MIRSDGTEHLGSALSHLRHRPFPGPPPGKGPPIRILPIGGLGEIGMNCMLIGVYDRYILVDAGLMFPDFTDLGMQKILPDTSFLAQWRDRIEAVFITHGHEDHIGALPWVIPALDPGTPIYAGPFAMQLVRRRATEYNLWGDGRRYRTFNMRERFSLGPFECEPLRVTHSIPDCCGFVLRSEHGTIVHTGDWKIDEHPLDGQIFDREAFENLAREGVALFMSDSTNVLSPGRTVSEASVESALAAKIASHDGKGRIVATQFASNVHRLGALKRAADAAGRKMCFMGMSLNSYLNAAHRVGLAPFDPEDLISPAEAEGMDPSRLLVVTTGSQAEPRAALSLAAHGASPNLKLGPSDLVIYSAKVIPGNETRVTEMMNAIAGRGAEIATARTNETGPLHSSGHACRQELEEVLRLVKPHHFLPVHGEFAFLCEHAQLARDSAGVRNTTVMRNGQMLGLAPRGKASTFAGSGLVGGAGNDGSNGDGAPFSWGPPGPGGESRFDAGLIGEAQLTMFYNDGGRGTGTAAEMALDERARLAADGVVVAAVDVLRSFGSGGPKAAAAAAAASGDEASPSASASTSSSSGNGSSNSSSPSSGNNLPARMRARVRVTTRAMWGDNGRLLERLVVSAERAVARLPPDATLLGVERAVAASLRREARSHNGKVPEVVVVAHEYDPRAAAAVARMRGPDSGDGYDERQDREESRRGGGGRGSRGGRGGGGGGRGGRGGRGGSARSSGGGSDSDGGSSSGGRRGGSRGGGSTSSSSSRRSAAAPSAVPAPEGVLRKRREANPREDPGAAAEKGIDISYG